MVLEKKQCCGQEPCLFHMRGYWVECIKCHKTTSRKYSSQTKAVTAWNRQITKEK
jgi:hypothetical protein